MYEYLLALMKALEREIKPPPGARHGIAIDLDGTEETGYTEKLSLRLALPSGNARNIFLDREDLEKPIPLVVAEVRALYIQLQGAQ